MSTRFTHAGGGAGYDDDFVSQVHCWILRLKPLFLGMETRNAGGLDHPYTSFLYVIVVVMPPPFKYAVGHPHKIMHPPDAMRDGVADKGDFRRKDGVHRNYANQGTGPCVDEEIATCNLGPPGLIFAESGSNLESRSEIVGQQLRKLVPLLGIAEADISRLQCLDRFDVQQVFSSIHAACSTFSGPGKLRHRENSQRRSQMQRGRKPGKPPAPRFPRVWLFVRAECHPSER